MQGPRWRNSLHTSCLEEVDPGLEVDGGFPEVGREGVVGAVRARRLPGSEVRRCIEVHAIVGPDCVAPKCAVSDG